MNARTTRRTRVLVPFATAVVTMLAASCGKSGDAGAGAANDAGSDASDGGTTTVFSADSPYVYVAKVKNLLVGLPPTDAEVQEVIADPTQLRALVATWQGLPQYQTKMRAFFMNAFQQTQITAADFVDMIPANGIGTGSAIPWLVQNITESYARTVLAMNAAKAPFTETMTTTTLMLTPPLMELYAFLDTYHADDQAKVTDSFATDFPGVSITQSDTYAGISAADAADPKSPNFMKWYDPDVATLDYGTADASCNGINPIVYPGRYYTLHYLLYGAVYNHPGPSGNCGTRSGKYFGVFTQDDFGESAWRMVTIRTPKPGEPITRFWDVGALRGAKELVINTPRPGFFSTPAFFANWSTNQSNQMRVTANQALIVATGMQVDGTDSTALSVPQAVAAGLDQAHAQPGTACYGCHQLLDPTRAVLSSAWTYSYYQQKDAAMIAQKGLFAFEGVTKPVGSVFEFGQTLADHPAFAGAWVQKLCYYANSAPCQTTDPEYQRLVKSFIDSKYDWNALVLEVFTSPITTNASVTVTTASHEVVSVTRKDHLCSALDLRLGFADVCGRSVISASKATTASVIAGGLPSDGYGRGSTIPNLPLSPTLFYRAGLENICESVAQMVIDPAMGSLPAGVKSWTSAAKDAAISDFVTQIMAITPSDPRHADAISILTDHYTAALAVAPTPPSTAKVTPTQALQSTFVAACLSPSFAGVGM